MTKVIAQMTIKLPRLMEVSEYRKLRYVGGKAERSAAEEMD